MSAPSAVVVVDTNVASFLSAGLAEAAAYRDVCQGRIGTLSFQTVAELRFGALHRRWGERRRAGLERFMAGHQIAYPIEATVDAWARLKALSSHAGSPIAADDLWVAATALAEGATLVSHDAAFRPLVTLVGLDLVCHA